MRSRRSPPVTTAPSNPLSDSEKIRGQLDRILASPDFLATRLQREFLRFVVLEKLAGRGNTIKGYTVATQVFGRKQDFDANSDPIVSIQANGLRRALERYYLLEGKEDPLVIDIPRGTFVPTFRWWTRRGPGRSGAGAVATGERFEGSWPILLVRPLQNLTGNQDLDFLAVGITTELAHEIIRSQEIRVLLMPLSGHGRRASDSNAAFSLGGNIMMYEKDIKVTVNLIGLRSGRQIWGDTHKSRFDAAKLIAFQEHISRAIATSIAGERGVISRTVSGESRNVPPVELKTYEAILRYHEYGQTFTPAHFQRAVEALTHAFKIEPENGQVQAMLARLYFDAYALGVPGFETALGKALTLAARGVVLSPDSQRAHGVLAYGRMISGDIEHALQEVERAIVLNPNSYLVLDGLAYLLTLLGEWKRGTAMIRKIVQINPYYLFSVHHALWLNWFRQGKYKQAYQETKNFKRPSLFWEPLMKAATLGHLARIDEGKKNVDQLLELKPDFPERARILIGHYIKFDDIIQSILSGLGKSGLKIR